MNWQISVFAFCFITGAWNKDIKETNLPPKNQPSNWKIIGTNWQPTTSNLVVSFCRTIDEVSTMMPGFWPIGDAKRVFLTIKTESRSECKTNITDNRDCQVSIAYSRVTSDAPIQEFNNKNATRFPEDTFFNSSTSALRTGVLSIDNVTDFTGLQFGFEITSFCGFIRSWQLTYYQCPRVSENLVNFNQTSAPDSYKQVEEVFGECTNFAALEIGSDRPKMECFTNGTYNIIGRCVCDAGYTNETTGTSCSPCDRQTFKASRGNVPCQACGRDTKEGVVPRTTCACKEGYFKRSNESNQVDADCFKPPEAPTNLQSQTSQPNEAQLSWTASIPGSDAQGDYVILCLNCPKAFMVNQRTSGTSITLTGLAAFASYKIQITKENEVTRSTGQSRPAEVTFTTQKGDPTIIQDVVNETLSDGTVKFTWKEPFGRGGDDISYVVTYGDTTLRLTELTFNIETDTQDRTYNVEIYAQATVNGVLRKGESYKTTITVNGGIPLGIALAIAFGIMVFVIVALVAAFCFWKRRNPAYLQVVRMPDGTVKLPSRFYSGGKVYVDPKTYPDVDDAVTEFAFEIQQDELKLGERIGEGEFADVYKGVLFRSGKDYQVAVKMLKPSSTKKDREDFLSEAAILGQFNDPNVVVLRGVILKEQPNAIILEYMMHGSLDTYLQNHDMQFTSIELLEMGRGVASGMKYLSEMGFIHRDLAARNILVGENRVCKIADFGMSMEILMDDSVESLSGRIPVRWTAPEAIQFKKFTTASDVWSYGIVLWEIMSYGERPYWNWTNYEVLEKVSSGYRLPLPMSCPSVVHDLMLCCWTKDRTRRPLFGVIRDRLDAWIRHPDLLEGSTVIELDDNLDYTVMQTINKWLEAIGMGRYAKNFIEQGFATPRQILLLTSDDLERLGIGPMDHRKRILKAIHNT
eukprot:TCONS_00024179-protein